MESEVPPNSHSEEVTLRDLILQLRAYIREWKRNWLLILAFCLPALAFYLYRHFNTPPTYPATVSFMVNEDEGNTMSGMASILGQFGFGRVGASRYNLDKILELSRSKHLIQKTLFESIEVNGKEDYIANHLIESYELDERWAKTIPELLDFKFTHDSIPIFNGHERKALKGTANLITGTPEDRDEALMANAYSEKSSIMRLSIESVSEPVSIALSNYLYDALSDFYVTKSTEQQKQTYEIMQGKKDSILQALRSSEYQLANFKETNRDLIGQTARLKELRLQRDVQALTIMYGEALKNMEIADFTLQNSTPFVQVIDRPFAPIKPETSSLVKSILLGILLGMFVGVCFVSGRKLVRDAVKD